MILHEQSALLRGDVYRDVAPHCALLEEVEVGTAGVTEGSDLLPLCDMRVLFLAARLAQWEQVRTPGTRESRNSGERGRMSAPPETFRKLHAS